MTGPQRLERELVSNEGSPILSWLKVQSTPYGNLGESSGDEIKLVSNREREKRVTP